MLCQLKALQDPLQPPSTRNLDLGYAIVVATKTDYGEVSRDSWVPILALFASNNMKL
ncbi:uncharacterized protein SEPMUDRAFT_147350 [Sphaerulina musiva SO2202]|uniref:Uncharacterized protein n=1 Tax=Sphaerulina musiva (strain SO2202) TaxID=692275 RepID=M3C5D5_SPHMS|nr:uncharacterized protein SEPMUDRAFT_147350 [Sphaerulina musiva SO2202]EMF15466.1 hypothetical protein SEPMUDRAFT_147350 [Sphaerulina musiva SO2202]